MYVVIHYQRLRSIVSVHLHVSCRDRVSSQGTVQYSRVKSDADAKHTRPIEGADNFQQKLDLVHVTAQYQVLVTVEQGSSFPTSFLHQMISAHQIFYSG